MRYKWLYREKREKLIIFFNGWGMDESVVKHLNPEKYDILMFYDYNTLETEFDFSQILQYKEIYLVAWSMGVMVATLFDKIKYKSKTAINGTLFPIHNKYGIPERIYDLTLKNFNSEGAKKFIKNMFLEPAFLTSVSRKFEEQKSELLALRGYRANTDFKYDRIIISSEDKIIPSKHQSEYWGIEPNLKAGHAPFNCFKNWSELL